MDTFINRISDRLIPAVPVPFDGSGTIDDELQAAYIAWMAEQPIGGVAVWAHTGRGMKLEQDQREHVLQAWRSGVKGAAVVCGVGVPESAATGLPNAPGPLTDAVLREAVTVAEQAAAGAADALLVHPPGALAGLPDSDDRIVDYHRAVCESGLPVLAFFLYEEAGGVSYGPALIERLLELEGVVGIKIATLDSVMTYQDILTVVDRVEGVLPITGEDRFLGYSLVAGARSALIGLGAALTACSARLVDTKTAGDWQGFFEVSSVVDTLAQATFLAPMDGYVQRMLWALEADGVFARPAFDPWRPSMPEHERDAVFAVVRRIRSR